MLPVAYPHPVGFTNPIVLRASAALAGAGAWDATPVETPVDGMDRMTLYFTYTRGGAGGAFDFQIQVSPYSSDQLVVQNWFPTSLYQLGVIVAGSDAQSRVQREYATYQATGAAVETFVHGPTDIKSVERIRLVARESGAVGTPGTLMIVGVLMR